MSKSYQHFINGQTVQGTSGRVSDIFNPKFGVVNRTRRPSHHS